MCVAFLALDMHAQYRVILGANRDEFFCRPSAAACFWEEAPWILAGKDLQAGGTWLGMTLNGHLALLTNFREPGSREASGPSRGGLIRDYLWHEPDPEEFLQHLQDEGSLYNGFNLLFGQGENIFYFSNRSQHLSGRLRPGIYGLSNGVLNSPWPKVERGRQALADHLKQEDAPQISALENILARRDRPADRDLPDTGVGLELERFLSPICILGREYGTRSTTLVYLDRWAGGFYKEKSWQPYSAFNRGYYLQASSVEYRFQLPVQENGQLMLS